jgi:hypothetical protein
MEEMQPGKRKEFLEPIVERALEVVLWFSPLSHIQDRTRRLVEIYVLCWYIGSALMLIFSQVFSITLDHKYFLPVAVLFSLLSAYRIFDCIFANIQISLLEVLNTKGQENRLTSRNVILLGINFLEFLNNFSIIYFSLSQCRIFEFFGLKNVVDALYFSLSTLTTLGFGDIYPVNMWAKIAVIIESLVGIVFLFVVLNVFVSTVQAARRKGGN